MLDNALIYSMIANFAVSLYLKLRQYRVLDTRQSDMAKLIQTPEEHKKTANYNKDRLSMALIEACVMFVKEVTFMQYRVYQKAYKGYFMHYMFSEILFFMFCIHLNRLIEIPFSLVSTFYIEARHGFNKTTLATFITDFLKSTVLISIILPVLLYFSTKIIQRWASFYLYLWVFVTVFQVVLIIVYPTFIQPLFNKFEVLKDDKLREDIEMLARRVGFKANKVFVMDGSKRSGHSNAYFIGLTNEKRVVLYDTLFDQMNNDEILAVLCHEFGHWKYSHTYKMISVGLVIQFAYLYLFNCTVNSEYIAKNLFYDTDSLMIKFIYFFAMISVIDLPLTFLSNAYSRKNEREADRYAVSLGHGKNLRGALVKLHRENKSSLAIDPLYSAINYSHPTLLERLTLIDEEINKLK